MTATALADRQVSLQTGAFSKPCCRGWFDIGLVVFHREFAERLRGITAVAVVLLWENVCLLPSIRR
jgi:hypothetical protein